MAIRKWKMYLENCTQIVFLKRKATSDFYDKKELSFLMTGKTVRKTYL